MQLAILHCDLAITLLARVGHVQEGLDMVACMSAAGGACCAIIRHFCTVYMSCQVTTRKVWALVVQSQIGCNGAVSMQQAVLRQQCFVVCKVSSSMQTR